MLLLRWALSAAAICFSSAGLGQQLPTTEQFQQLLTACAAGSNLRIDANLIGSVVGIYSQDKTQGKASVSSEAIFLSSIPSVDKLKAYELYLKCITSIIPTVPVSSARFSAVSATASSVLRSHSNYCQQTISKYWSDYPGNRQLGTPEWYTRECSDATYQKYAGKGWTVRVEFTNSGPVAVEALEAALFVPGQEQPLVRSIGRLATEVRFGWTFEGLSDKPKRVAVCLSYMASGQQGWALYAGEPPDRSGPLDRFQLAKITNDREAGRDAALDKIDDGMSLNSSQTCYTKAAELRSSE